MSGNGSWADDASGFADKDVLELSMIVKDPCFLQQIESDGYDPDSFYKFNVENGLVEVSRLCMEKGYERAEAEK